MARFDLLVEPFAQLGRRVDVDLPDDLHHRAAVDHRAADIEVQGPTRSCPSVRPARERSECRARDMSPRPTPEPYSPGSSRRTVSAMSSAVPPPLSGSLASPVSGL